MSRRIRHAIWKLIVVAVFLSNRSVQAEVLQLARDGQAIVPVVISATASDGTKATANELASYLTQISGARFDVQTGDGSTGIVLGTLQEFPNPKLEKALEIRNIYDGREAFAIRTETNRLMLIGATELGATHAAFRLLERLGCRWFFPAKEWEIVPSTPDLRVSLDEEDRPRILFRRIWYGHGQIADKGHPRGGSATQDYEAWTRHNLMAGSFTVYAAHAWQAIIVANKATFEEHPEYLALVKGVRTGEQLCVSNPEVRRLAVEWALQNLETNPTRDMVSMECSDGVGQCECEDCRRLGSISDRVFGMANHVARAVARRFPDKMVGCLAYNEHSEPPSFELEPNVYVQLTAGFTRGRYTYEELIDLWPTKCRKLGFYEYFSVWQWNFDKFPGGNGGNITRTKAMIDRYFKAGATSFDAESGNNWGLHGRGYYIANKLMWNPDSDVPLLLDDFYKRAFGPGAAAMRRYYERIAPDNDPIISRGLVGEAFRDVEEAVRVTQGHPDIQARLDQLKHYLHYVHLRWQLDHEKDKARQKELTVAVLTLAYRTRYEYMNHWNSMRVAFAREAAKQFNEPGWASTANAPKPWIVEQPVTKGETDAWFREGMRYFPPTPTEERTFSSDLVPSNLAGPNSIVSSQRFMRSATYALYSRSGEPLEIEFTSGVVVHFRDRPAARWWLRNGNGNEITSGSVQNDGEPHRLVIRVPQADTYFLEVEAAAGCSFKVEPGRSVSLINKRGSTFTGLGQMQEMYFYVPRGTRKLQYFWNGGVHKVLGPNKQVMAEVSTNDEVVTIPVPAGMDGRMWSFSPSVHSQLWFYNVPNYIAASPAALLIPREALR